MPSSAPTGAAAPPGSRRATACWPCCVRVPLSRDAEPLVEALRERLGAGGLFFEAHAARTLAGGARPAVPAELQGDLRWLLAALAREAQVQPEIEPLRQRLLHEIATRQLDVALASVKDGETRIDVPVAFGHLDTTARLAVKDDGPPPGPGERPRGRAISLTVAHPELGPIDAAAQWQPGGSPGDLQIRFAVRDDGGGGGADAADRRPVGPAARRRVPSHRHHRRRRSRRGHGPIASTGRRSRHRAARSCPRWPSPWRTCRACVSPRSATTTRRTGRRSWSRVATATSPNASWRWRASTASRCTRIASWWTCWRGSTSRRTSRSRSTRWSSEILAFLYRAHLIARP